MLRSNATRSLLRSFTKTPAYRAASNAASHQFQNASPLRKLSNNRPRVLAALSRPSATTYFYATKSTPPLGEIDTKAEAEIAKQKIVADPKDVSGGSSVRHIFEHSQGEEKGPDMTAGLKADIETIKDTFSLASVPKESLYIGAAGVLPYAATSISTVFLAFDINHAHAHGTGYLFTPETAHQLLDLVTPIQIGYGAVVSL